MENRNKVIKKLQIRAINEKSRKPGSGGKRDGAGKKKGQGRKEPTKVKRIPVAIEPQIDELIDEYRNGST